MKTQRYLAQLCLAQLYLTLFTAPLLCHANFEQQWHWQTEAGYRAASSSDMFEQQDAVVAQSALWWNPSYRGWVGQLSALGYVDHRGEQELDLSVNELFWMGQWGELDWLVGKHRSDYGVSYAHRPLDIFLPFRQNPVGIQIEEGVGIVAGSYFTSQGELTVLYSDSHFLDIEDRLKQRGVGLRYYQLDFTSEWQGILYWDDRRKLNAGGSWVSTFGDSWELHLEGRYQQRYQQPALNSRVGDAQWQQPLSWHEQDHGWQMLVGGSYSSHLIGTVIMEYWYDGRALSHQQWQSAIATTAWLRAQPHYGNLWQAGGALFGMENLQQHNLMLHWQKQLQPWTNRIDLMFSPHDQGMIATASSEYELSQRWLMRASLRYFGGASDSLYQQLPESSIALLSLEGRF